MTEGAVRYKQNMRGACRSLSVVINGHRPHNELYDGSNK